MILLGFAEYGGGYEDQQLGFIAQGGFMLKKVPN